MQLQKLKGYLLFTTLIALSATSYSQKKVLVAIASKEVKCRSGNAGYTATNDISMKYVQGNFDYNTQVENLTNQLENTYGTEGVKIRTRQAYGKVVVILKYRKNTSPYDCVVWEYALGGGNNDDEALSSARRGNNVGSSYDVVANIDND